MKERTFGSDLLQFAITASFIDQSTFNQIHNRVRRYVKDALQIDTFELLLGIMVNGRRGLQPLWGRKYGFAAYQIRNPDSGELQGQCAWCFHSERPLWIVGEDQLPLSSTKSFVDRWSNTEEIPEYKEFQSDRNRTLISVPMKRADGTVFGVADFESTEYLEPSLRAREEFENLAEAMAALYLTLQEVGAKQERIEGLIADLGEGSLGKDLFRVVKPKLFFAYSSKADLEVVGIIGEVLDEFADKLDIRNWQEFTASGNINQQILEEISDCRFGICYMSERCASSDDAGFRDNPNVLFEAGMLQALSRSPVSEPRNWIPIREVPPPRVPFDFSSERIIQVTRNKNGLVNKAKLSSELHRRMVDLLS